MMKRADLKEKMKRADLIKKRCKNSFTGPACLSVQILCKALKRGGVGSDDRSQVLLMPGSGPLAAATLGAMGRYFNSLLH